jgi:Leucine-rich repeat (LRR) protein
MLSELPIRGLTSNNQLRYLLLEKNKLTSLPNEIANLKGLTALSLTDNPLGKL